MLEITTMEQKKEKRMRTVSEMERKERNEDTLRDLWDNIRGKLLILKEIYFKKKTPGAVRRGKG